MFISGNELRCRESGHVWGCVNRIGSSRDVSQYCRGLVPVVEMPEVLSLRSRVSNVRPRALVFSSWKITRGLD